MEATLFSTFLDGRLFTNRNQNALIDEVEQLNYVCVPHANATMAVRPADRFLMFRAVNVNEPIARIGVVLLGSIQPQNPRRDEIFGRRQRIIRTERNARLKNRSRFGVVADLFRDSKLA